MKALRIKLAQSSANYRREESDRNKMTYPLPPASTVIGAIHYACGYKELRLMDVSIQGSFKAMHREPYTDNCFLNSVFNDRGILVKMSNESMISSSYTKVAAAIKSQGNDFRRGVTIDVYNDNMLEEYRDLLNKRDEIEEFKKTRIVPALELIKKRKKYLAIKKKQLNKDDDRYKSVIKRETEIKKLEKSINEKFKFYKEENYEKPYSLFRTLVKSIKYYEILNEVELLIHIKADEEILNEVLENIYNIKSLGRSEDFVEVLDAQIVELEECTEIVNSKNSAYVNYDDLVSGEICIPQGNRNGTKYYINKNYKFENKNKKLVRVFEKQKVIYTSKYRVNKNSKNVLIDNIEGEKYIVSFI